MSKKKKLPLILHRQALPDLLQALKDTGYQIIGPQVRDGAILLDELSTIDELPVSFQDTQKKHSYRLQQTNDKHLFHFNVGPYSPKKFLFPPEIRMHRISKTTEGFDIESEDDSIVPTALFGIKPCELAALEIQDKVFMHSQYTDPNYTKRRKNTITIVTNCTRAGNLCFCSSMNTGPKADAGYDLALTEVYDKKTHYFLIESGSKIGDKILSKLPTEEADDAQVAKAAEIIEETRPQITKTLNTANLPALLYETLNHDHWEEVAERCLSCGNCTMVCPTCFCSSADEVTALTGEFTDRVRSWDSCFSREYSYIHGGSVRSTIKARYRQWLTHKLGGWHEQFGTSGCVGCGRCISWCPVGIDITEEANTLRAIAEETKVKEEITV